MIYDFSPLDVDFDVWSSIGSRRARENPSRAPGSSLWH
jgi:hypothetical protein